MKIRYAIAYVVKVSTVTHQKTELGVRRGGQSRTSSASAFPLLSAVLSLLSLTTRSVLLLIFNGIITRQDTSSRHNRSHLPRSLILYTPAALELARLCPFFSVGGDDDKPEMAESTLVSSAVSADMLTFDGTRVLRIHDSFG